MLSFSTLFFHSKSVSTAMHTFLNSPTFLDIAKDEEDTDYSTFAYRGIICSSIRDNDFKNASHHANTELGIS